jgi:7,8-dihydroneopterin aldolase/epimerase/oxygenase
MQPKNFLWQGLRFVPDDLQLTQTVRVEDIRIEAYIGVHGHEKNRRQSLIIAATVEVIPPQHDEITETIDYNMIVDHSRTLADEGISLIETFANKLAYALMSQPYARSAEVYVIKPGALSNGTASCTATLVRNISC